MLKIFSDPNLRIPEFFRRIISNENAILSLDQDQRIRMNVGFVVKHDLMDRSSNEIKELYEQGNIPLQDILYFIDYSTNTNLQLVEYFENQLDYRGTDVAFNNMTYKKFTI